MVQGMGAQMCLVIWERKVKTKLSTSPMRGRGCGEGFKDLMVGFPWAAFWTSPRNLLVSSCGHWASVGHGVKYELPEAINVSLLLGTYSFFQLPHDCGIAGEKFLKELALPDFFFIPYWEQL